MILIKISPVQLALFFFLITVFTSIQGEEIVNYNYTKKPESTGLGTECDDGLDCNDDLVCTDGRCSCEFHSENGTCQKQATNSFNQTGGEEFNGSSTCQIKVIKVIHECTCVAGEVSSLHNMETNRTYANASTNTNNRTEEFTTIGTTNVLTEGEGVPQTKLNDTTAEFHGGAAMTTRQLLLICLGPAAIFFRF